jgi:diguanylate cyclase (GGDEF)-like protein
MLWIEVRLMEADLRETASTDLLTGLLNRRATRERFDQEVSRCARLNEKFGLILFDIDHFKKINDTYGHQVGDRVLREVAQAMDRCKRKEDVLGRIGGEEFVVILPLHDREDTLKAAHRLRMAVRESTVNTREADSARVTISGGIALYPDDGDGWDGLYTSADRRMYRAKDSGRDRVEDRSS